jgi:hypothetical protein
MESVLDSARSWRDLTAGLLPRVASAAQVEAKRLSTGSQAASAAELARSLRKAAEKLSTRSDALLAMVEELREVAALAAAAEEAAARDKSSRKEKEKEKGAEKKKHRDKDKDKEKDKSSRGSHKRGGGAASPLAEDGGGSGSPAASARAERAARAERMAAADSKSKTPPPPPPPPPEDSPLPSDEFTAVSLEELVASVRAAARLPESLRARDVVAQGCAKRIPLAMPFYTKTDDFTKTGSGQT